MKKLKKHAASLRPDGVVRGARSLVDELAERAKDLPDREELVALSRRGVDRIRGSHAGDRSATVDMIALVFGAEGVSERSLQNLHKVLSRHEEVAGLEMAIRQQAYAFIDGGPEARQQALARLAELKEPKALVLPVLQVILEIAEMNGSVSREEQELVHAIAEVAGLDPAQVTAFALVYDCMAWPQPD